MHEKSKIAVLDPETKDKIAAGEVIERPASVVKELVENSIDAGSTRITVELQGGGLDCIKVSDNGWGMDRQEALMAFKRHATSKIRSLSDLEKVSSLGFRGEALPSIAAVSEIILYTKESDALEGTKVTAYPGQEPRAFCAGCPSGTTVIANNLFKNVPPRRKTLKSPGHEISAVTDTMQKISLAHPEISFQYSHENGLVFQTADSNDLMETIACIYGTETAMNMLKIGLKHKEIHITGYTSKPCLTRGNRKDQVFIVNGRNIYHETLQEAVKEAYYTLLPVHRYPVVVLNLKVSPEYIDPNVHPAKMTVRFLEEDLIMKTVQKAIKEALSDAKVVPEIKERAKNNSIRVQGRRNAAVREQKAVYQEAFTAQEFFHREKKCQHISSQETERGPETNLNETLIENTNYWHSAVKSKKDNSFKETFPSLQVIDQLGASYILARGDLGLFIIDQHAAHERIRYEYYKKKFAGRGVEIQYLAVPPAIELTPEESSLIDNNQEFLNSAGITLEHFGGRSFILRTLPIEIKNSEAENFIREILLLLRNSKVPNMSTFIEKTIILAACKSAVKANQILKKTEMDFILDHLAATEVPYTCPHGRPTLIHITFEEIKKYFKRI